MKYSDDDIEVISILAALAMNGLVNTYPLLTLHDSERGGRAIKNLSSTSFNIGISMFAEMKKLEAQNEDI